MQLLLLASLGDWGEDEIFLLVGCGGASVFAVWWVWHCLAAVPRLGVRPAVHQPLLNAIAASFAFLCFVTWRWTAVEIRGGQDYTVLALVMGGAWFLFYARFFRWLGVGFLEDACERTNPAAVVALCGAIPGGMLLYCGSICGEGPSFWNNVFTVLVAGAGWFAVWFLLDLAGGVSRRVAEERDLAAGRRLAGFLLASGLILGRAAAGNWQSMEATVVDLWHDGWPALALVALAAAWERLSPAFHNPETPVFSLAGWSAGMVYVLTAVAWVGQLGWWEGVP